MESKPVTESRPAPDGVMATPTGGESHIDGPEGPEGG